ncbi:unnamed protein product [Paramecium sonneborni]|uniref:Uncharacterized protein n=1 Tax=Paramecium sonneborni TaxID=65129 RepID=A0A8S1MM39_9CILI|nr:unnamed protein product [Paramecium sonneborni]CAD8075934.1 unnamed protein product [Paramecium sonneborni]
MFSYFSYKFSQRIIGMVHNEKRKSIILLEQNCEKEIIIYDIFQIVGNKKKEETLDYTLNITFDDHASNLSWYPTQDCQYAFVLGNSDDKIHFGCLKCKIILLKLKSHFSQILKFQRVLNYKHKRLN